MRRSREAKPGQVDALRPSQHRQRGDDLKSPLWCSKPVVLGATFPQCSQHPLGSQPPLESSQGLTLTPGLLHPSGFSPDFHLKAMYTSTHTGHTCAHNSSVTPPHTLHTCAYAHFHTHFLKSTDTPCMYIPCTCTHLCLHATTSLHLQPSVSAVSLPVATCVLPPRWCQQLSAPLLCSVKPPGALTSSPSVSLSCP